MLQDFFRTDDGLFYFWMYTSFILDELNYEHVHMVNTFLIYVNICYHIDNPIHMYMFIL